jgi:hypothetical protein
MDELHGGSARAAVSVTVPASGARSSVTRGSVPGATAGAVIRPTALGSGAGGGDVLNRGGGCGRYGGRGGVGCGRGRAGLLLRLEAQRSRRLEWVVLGFIGAVLVASVAGALL